MRISDWSSDVCSSDLVEQLAAAQRADIASLAGTGIAGHDVDDAVYGIGSPQRRAGAADHLYAVDIFGDDILHVPIDAGKQRRINAPAVDQDEQLVGEVLRLGISAQPDRKSVE